MAHDLTEYFPMSRKCQQITTQFYDDPLASPFLRAFRGTPDVLERYRAAIQTPMDITTVRNRIVNYHYANYKEWAKDMFLIFDNAISFNGAHSVLGGIATYLKGRFEKRLEQLKLLNIRNFEAEVIAASVQLQKAIQSIPSEYGISYDYELIVPESEPFTAKRLHRLAHDLDFLSERGFGPAIYKRLRETNGDVEYDPVGEIDIAMLPRRALIALENLAMELRDEIETDPGEESTEVDTESSSEQIKTSSPLEKESSDAF
jgi:hypothetical protein